LEVARLEGGPDLNVNLHDDPRWPAFLHKMGMEEK
jgi:hypothetical protein